MPNFVFLVMIAALFPAKVALAGADVQLEEFLPFLSSWPEFGKVMAFVVGLQVLLRGLAEGLTRISAMTDNTWDNKVAAVFSQTAWFLGAILGKIGYGEPKLVSDEKVENAVIQREVDAMTSKSSKGP